MSKVQHTPGPWFVAISGSFETEIRASSRRRVAATWVQGPAKSREGALNQGRVNEANARLIAAAPDLLEALKLFERSIEVVGEREVYAIIELSKDDVDGIRGIIAKAEGGEA